MKFATLMVFLATTFSIAGEHAGKVPLRARYKGQVESEKASPLKSFYIVFPPHTFPKLVIEGSTEANVSCEFHLTTFQENLKGVVSMIRFSGSATENSTNCPFAEFKSIQGSFVLQKKEHNGVIRLNGPDLQSSIDFVVSKVKR